MITGSVFGLSLLVALLKKKSQFFHKADIIVSILNLFKLHPATDGFPEVVAPAYPSICTLGLASNCILTYTLVIL